MDSDVSIFDMYSFCNRGPQAGDVSLVTFCMCLYSVCGISFDDMSALYDEKQPMLGDLADRSNYYVAPRVWYLPLALYRDRCVQDAPVIFPYA